MEGTSDDEVKWDLQSSGDEGGTATEAPVQVQAKPKKARSKGQLAAFQKARARQHNILKKKKQKYTLRGPHWRQSSSPPLKKKKKQRVVYEETEQEASSSDEDVLVVRRP
jgi:hypothetical protein